MTDPTGPFIVLAEFIVPPGSSTEFLQLCAFDADSSLQHETGCRQFEAHVVADAPDAVILYEVYDDRAAFDAHLATSHYATFAAGVTRLGVDRKQVRFLRRVGI